MDAKQIFKGTMPFNMAKLLLGGLTVVLSVALFAVLMGIGWLFGDAGMLITFCIWLAGTGLIRFVIMHYMGYMVKAGHIAVIAEVVNTGVIPPDQVSYGKQKVTERFATSNIYFGIDKLVTAAVKQIQRGIERVGNALDFIPGMDAISGAAKFFVDISLGYIDECCLGYTFLKSEQSAFKSAADGVVIYAQNWKTLLKDAAKTMGKVILLLILMTIVIFVPIGIIFKLLKWSPIVALLLACLVAWVIKFAFIDSYIMIQMMSSYMSVAPTTQLSFDLYGKLSGVSSSFKELYDKGVAESPAPAPSYGYGQPTQAPYTTAASPSLTPSSPQAQPQSFASNARGNDFGTPQPNIGSAQKPVFCGQCGVKNEPGTKFCGECGAKLS